MPMLRVACATTLVVLLASRPAQADTPRSETPQRARKSETPQRARKDGIEAHDGFRGELSAVSLLVAGHLPSIGSGAYFAAGFRWPHFSAALGARLLTTLSGTTSHGVRVHAFSATSELDFCWHRSFLSGCGVFAAGEIRPFGESVYALESHGILSATAGLRLGADWLFSEHIALRGLVELHTQINTSSFWLNNTNLWNTPPIFGVVGLGFMFPLQAL